MKSWTLVGLALFLAAAVVVAITSYADVSYGDLADKLYGTREIHVYAFMATIYDALRWVLPGIVVAFIIGKLAKGKANG